MKARMVLATAAVIAALALAGCGVLQQKTPQALPTVVLGGGSADSGSTTAGSGAASESSEVQSEAGSDRNSYSAPASSSAGKAGVVASGNITPKQEAALAFAIAARVKSVEVKTGDAVKTGQVLARLAGSERLEAAVETANLELLAAQKALADLNEAAASTLADTQLRLAKAKDALDQAEKRRLRQQRAMPNKSSESLEAWMLSRCCLASQALTRTTRNFSRRRFHRKFSAYDG